MTTAPRPTHADRWHRVARLTPRLASDVRIARVVTRGEVWHVAEQPTTNAFFRMNTPAYRLVCRLDGRRTVEEALNEAEEQSGDDAPTKAEAVQLLSQLHDADLLRLESDVRLEPVIRRARTRRRREARSHLGALLFVRIPLFNPNRLLDALAPFAAPFVSPLGALLWCVVIALGLWALAGETDRLVRATGSVLDTSNLMALYAVIAIVKGLHELGHGLALKALARKHRGAGVYRVGVMLLLFLPFPYIDASGAWKLRSKWERALVGLAGMIVELFVAAIAAIVWARSGEGTLIAQLAFNIVLASGVSTILFNANPLLRYDGYHVLSDLLETPNLANRAAQQLTALIKRVGFGVRSATGTASTRTEANLFIAYALASIAYRVFLYAMIGLFVLRQQFALGLLLLLIACVELVITPLWKGVSYLLTSAELATHRARAGWVVASTLALVLVPLLVVPLPRHARLDAIVEPADATVVHAPIDAPLTGVREPGALIDEGERVLTLTMRELEHERERLRLRRERLELARRVALRDDPDALDDIEARLSVIDDELAWVEERLSERTLVAEREARWIPAADWPEGAFVRTGEPLGVLVHANTLRLRARADAGTPGDLEAARSATARLRGSMREHDVAFVRTERIEDDAGQETLTFVYELGGGIDARLGQRASVRVRVGDATLAQRLWEAVLSVFQQRGEA